MAANFEKFLISPDFPINFRKSHQISNNYFKSSESYGQKPPCLNRVKVIGTRPMAPVLNTGLLEGVSARNVTFFGKERNY